MKPYHSWAQVSGYFDGDGNFSISDLSNQPFKLGLQVIFTDQSLEQVSMLRTFLTRKGIRTSNMLRTSKGTAWMIAVGNLEGVLSITKAMLPYLYKKANEACAVIDYYEGRITGNKLFSLLEREVKAGRREKRNHMARASVPYTFPDGDAIMKKRRKEKIRSAIARTRAKVVKSDYHSVRREFSRNGLRLADIGRKYPQYSKENIRRILGCDRGYVLVVGEGLKRGRRCIRKHSNSVSSKRSRFKG